MRATRAMVVGALLCLAAPSYAQEGDRKATDAIPTAELPRTGIVFDVPKDAFVVGIAADGTLVINDREGGLNELHAALRAVAHVPAYVNADGSVRVNVVLRTSVDVPWQVVQWVMQACAQEKLSRVHFAVRPEAGDEEGVLDAFLPWDRDGGDPFSPTLQAYLFADEGTTDPGAIFAMFRTLVEGAGATRVEINTPPKHVPRAGHVVSVVDLARRAGVTRITFTGAALPFPPFPARRDASGADVGVTLADLRAWVAERARTLAKGLRVRVGRALVVAPADGKPMPLPPPPPRGKAVEGTALTLDAPPEEDVLAKPPTLKETDVEAPATEGDDASPDEPTNDGLVSAGGGYPRAFGRRATRQQNATPGSATLMN